MQRMKKDELHHTDAYLTILLTMVVRLDDGGQPSSFQMLGFDEIALSGAGSFGVFPAYACRLALHRDSLVLKKTETVLVP